MTQPIKKYKSGNISGALWFNEREVNGNIVGFKTLSITRSWKDKDTWRNEALNIRKQDIAKVILILNKLQEDLFLEGREGYDNED
jgi:hypothetical protein